MTVLEKLFNNDEPKKNGSVTPTSTGTTEKGKKVCVTCGSEVWAIHTKDGVCNDCRKSKKGNIEPPKQNTPPATPEKTPTPVETKSEGRIEGLESDKWHNDPASFNQTSFLKKHTGLKTWGLEADLSKLQASELISVIREDSANIPRVSEILIEKFGCEKYVRPNGKVKNEEAVQEAQEDDQANMAAILAEIQTLKASNRALKAANTRMSKAS
jgi:hypothetical protein